MTIHTDNMEKVQDWGENPPADTWYHVRISKVEEVLLSPVAGEVSSNFLD